MKIGTSFIKVGTSPRDPASLREALVQLERRIIALEEVPEDTVSLHERWTVLGRNEYNSTPSSTYQIEVSPLLELADGMPIKLRFDDAEDFQYYVVTNVSGTTVDLSGPALNVANPIWAAQVGAPELVQNFNIDLIGTYGTGAPLNLTSLLRGCPIEWCGPPAFLVAGRVRNRVVCTGPNFPYINIYNGANAVFTNGSGNGCHLSTTAWQLFDGANVDSDYYEFAYADTVAVMLTADGSAADAEDISVMLTFVIK